MWEKSLSEYAGVNAGNAETVKDSFLSVYESDIHGELEALCYDITSQHEAFSKYGIVNKTLTFEMYAI